MSEPETRLPTPGRVPQGSTSVGALPPLTLPPPRLDPLAGISSVHHSYASPSLTTQMMPSPIVQSGMMSPVSTQSPLSHQMLSPQQKSQVPPTGQAPQPQQLQDVRRQSVMLGQDQIRGQFSHTVTTLPSNKRPNEMGRQIQSVPNSPASLAVSTPPQSVQVRHSSLDAQLSPGSSSVGNPSPSYSNHSSPSVVQLHNGHGPPGSYVQSSTMHSHTGPSLTRYSSLPTQEQLQHHVAVGSLAAGSSKQGYQHEIQSRPVHQVASSMASTTQRAMPTQTPQAPTLLQQQLSVRPSRVSSQASTTITGGQPNVVIQQQPLPQISSQQNGQQCSLKARPIPTQETLSRQLQSTSNQQQHVVMGLLHGAQLQQQQADGGPSGCGIPTVTNPHVRQILANRSSQALAVPGSSTAQQGPSHSQTSSPPRISPSTLQQQVVVPHGILPSQANLPLRNVLAAQQQQLTQQQLLQQQRQQQQVAVQQAPAQQQLRLSGRVVGTASGALATLYDTDKSTATLTNKDAYRILKRRFKYLVYENECYQEELRNLQRKLLKLSRDKNFLLDRLGQFEKFSDSSDEDSDASHKTCDEKPKPKKRIRPAQRKRAADEGLEGSNAVKRPTEESIVSSPSPSESPIMDPRTSAYASASTSSQSYRQMANTAPPSYERMPGPTSVPMSGSSFMVPQSQNVLQMGPSTVQPQQQILRSTLARVVPSSMLAQQAHSSQPYPSSSRHVVDTRPIVAKVRVEIPSVSAMAGSYQGDQLKQQSLHKALSKAPISSQSMPMEYSHLSQEVLPSNPVNGDNYAASTSSALGPPVSMAPPPLESSAPLQPVSTLSSSFINGMLPDASGYAEKKEDKCSAAILAPTTSQHR
ncbi:hypothetical protein Y032_0035g3071 [Ancylostoma ceylanicum]|uniref:INO80 complex subunit E N-terminal domain-containing protein n=2 Tax=Ancylostoma ceylanicum TaxID=53326 RepID=A0A016UM93_9BILA|nr:hypothetical protein Y032_0035g3071 [Ancylostoma ceylanicum]